MAKIMANGIKWYLFVLSFSFTSCLASLESQVRELRQVFQYIFQAATCCADSRKWLFEKKSEVVFRRVYLLSVNDRKRRGGKRKRRQKL